MALKRDRLLPGEFTEISYFMNAVAEKGGVVSIVTVGSGAYPGNPNNTVAYAANPSGQTPKGVLLDDVIQLDLTRFHPNFYREQVPVGYKVSLATRGWVSTNLVIGTPVGTEHAYLAASGNISPSQATGAPQVGDFESTLDEDGYARFRIKIG
jgi:hypothetical protein